MRESFVQYREFDHMVVNSSQEPSASLDSRQEILSQKEGLTKLFEFLCRGTDFTSLRSFTVNLENRDPGRERTSVFSYYVGREKGSQLYLDLSLPSDFSQGDWKFVYVVPKAEMEKGARPYFWLDVYPEYPSEKNSDQHPIFSCRLRPEEPVNKIDLRHWHNLGEQLIVDYLLGENNITFDDLISFTVKIRKKKALIYYLASNQSFSLNLVDNSSIQDADIVQFTPGQDPKKLYQWIDILKVLSNAAEADFPIISSFRLLPEQHAISGYKWLGSEKQLLVDYLSGSERVTFTDLVPIKITIPPKHTAVSLGNVNGRQIEFYFPQELKPGEDIIIVPRQDEQGFYQYLDLYRCNLLTQLEGDALSSARIVEGGINQRYWQGPQRQLLKDFLNGAVQFENLRPIPLQVGDTLVISLWKESGKKVCFAPSRFFGLSKGDRISLVPTEHKGNEITFVVMKDELRLGIYKFDTLSKTFKLSEILYQAREGWWDDKEGIYIDTEGEHWVSMSKIAKKYRLAVVTVRRHLQGVRQREYVHKHGKVLYHEESARKILEGAGYVAETEPKRRARLSKQINPQQSVQRTISNSLTPQEAVEIFDELFKAEENGD